MAIDRQIKPRYKTRNEEIVAELRETAGAAPPIDPKMKVKRLTAEVAFMMALIHGGDWTAKVDHDAQAVFVLRC